jgi:Ribonuclease G/E
MSCPTCRGNGVIKSDATLAAEIFRAVQVKAAEIGESATREIVVRAHPDVVAYLEGDARDGLERLRAQLDVKITVQMAGGHPHREEYQLLPR